MSFWESIKLAPTYDLVFAVISIILIIGAIIFFSYMGIKEHKARKAVDAFIQYNQDKIAYVETKINMCSSLEELDLVSRWAKAIGMNLRTEMSNICNEYGYECGSKILNNFKCLISLREEALIFIF
jgi:hypothetical protein